MTVTMMDDNHSYSFRGYTDEGKSLHNEKQEKKVNHSKKGKWYREKKFGGTKPIPK